MKILVTGGSGFIGRKLVAELSRQGHFVNVLSRQPGTVFTGNVEVVNGDLTVDGPHFDTLLDGCEVIFHCAGEIRDEVKMRSLNVEGTRRLLDAAVDQAKQSGRTIHWVQLSSVGAYGPPTDSASIERIVTEDTRTRPVGEYETTKTAADELVIDACHNNLMTYSIIRPSNVFGRDMTNQSLRSLGVMIRKRLFFYIGKPGAIATYVHVDDVVEAFLRCGFDQRAKGRIYNVSNDCQLEELVKSISNSLHVKPPSLRLPEYLVRAGAGIANRIATTPLTRERIDALVSRTRYPCDKLERELGYKPEKSVAEFIDEALQV